MIPKKHCFYLTVLGVALFTLAYLFALPASEELGGDVNDDAKAGAVVGFDGSERKLPTWWQGKQVPSRWATVHMI